MRFPRLTDFAHEALAALTFNTEKPAADSISAKLWAACEDVAQDSLNSDFMQGLGKGTLSPDKYGQYIVQDCAYCANAADDYKTFEGRAAAAGEPKLAAFAKARYESYEKFNASYLPAWHVGDPNSLILNEAGKQYIAHEKAASTKLHPIYGVIAQVPCEQLWPWLAEQLKPGSPDHNVYNFWISENGSFHGAHRLDNFIDEWFAGHPDEYDWDTALWVMRGSMIGELNMFRAACGQSLTDMPEMPSA